MMPPALLLSALLTALAVVASPAAAQRRNEVARPSPCDFFVPTGEALPRQDTSFQSTFLYDVPNPGYRDRRAGAVGQGEPVTILQECGMKLRVRTVRGDEGWMNTAALPNELKLMERAAKRPIESDRDCEQRILDARLVAECKAALASRRAYQREAATSTYLTGDELRRLLAGKTLVIAPRRPDPRDKPNPVTAFFAADGEFFMASGEGGTAMRWRGRWTVEKDVLCLPGAAQPCARFRKVGELLVWANERDQDYVFTATEGDSAGTVALVSRYYPKAKPPPAPSGAGDFAMPTLGR